MRIIAIAVVTAIYTFFTWPLRMINKRKPREEREDANYRLLSVLVKIVIPCLLYTSHSNGDAASEQFLNSYEKALIDSENENKYNLRPVMIHCQTVREDQVDRMAKINMIPSIFVDHTYYWGDIHLNNFGEVRGNKISPVRTALDKGLVVNFHQDTPVLKPNMFQTIWAATNRAVSYTHLKICNTNKDIVKLNEGALENDKVRIINDDAYKYLEKNKELYDVILVDLPDPNDETLNKLSLIHI